MEPKTKRPVCYSLHHFWKKPESASQAVVANQAVVAVQAVPEARPSWKKAEEEQAAAEASRVAEVAAARPDVIVQRPTARKPRNFRGGRPRRARGASKGKYICLTGQQKLFVCEFLQERLTQPGGSRRLAFALMAARFGCAAQTVSKIWANRDFWMEW